MMTLKAIDTAYKGYLFRSRLEARWAVFFDALGLKWEYEVEGYDLDGVWYLPDFLVKTPQGADMWVEVKREDVVTDPKFERFKKTVSEQLVCSRVFLVSGTPLQHFSRRSICLRCGALEDWDWSEVARIYRATPDLLALPDGLSDARYGSIMSYCFPCDVETPQGGDNPSLSDGLFGLTYDPYKGYIRYGEGEVRRVLKRVREAATKAQQARFEHGACG
jgi:hypothetical protein